MAFMNKIWLPILIALGLCACGGGGGGGNSSSSGNGSNSGNGGSGSGGSSPTSFPLASAFSALSQTNHSYNLSALSGADNYTMEISDTPGTQQLFEGHLSSTLVQLLIMKKNGVVVSTGSSTSYFDVSPFMGWGSISGDGSYEVTSGQQPLPSSATVGQSGALETDTTYTSSAKILISSYGLVTWSLESDTATSAWACINSTTAFTNNAPAVSGAQCYRVDQTGNISAMKVTVYDNGKALTFQ